MCNKSFKQMLNQGSVVPSFVATVVAAAAAVSVMPAAAQERADAVGSFAKGRIIVMQRAGLPPADLEKALKPHGGKAKRIGRSDLHVVELPPGMPEEVVVKQLARHPHLKFAELDRKGTVAFVPNDPYYGSQWHAGRIGSDRAWDAAQGAGVTIAIIDTGVDGAHPDLASNMVPGWNFVDNNADTSDVKGHGTQVAGAAAGVLSNGAGVAGLAGKAKIMPLRVTASDGSFYYSAVAKALTWAADNGARVANMSIYGALNSSSIISAAQYMKSKGGLVLASAGNNGKDEGWAASTSMITVAATGSTDVRPSWSSYGSFVSLSAPGVGIWTTSKGGGYGAISGTSLASPVAAGVAALMMSANPKLTGADVEGLLFKTAVDLGAVGLDPYYGHGRVDAGAAVTAAAVATSTADSAAPTAVIAAPLAGSTVSGIVPVNVSASDNLGVGKVVLMVNGVSVATDTVSPFAFSWDSGAVANGTATLKAVAYDAAGNSGASSTVSVVVSNQQVATDTIAPTASFLLPTSTSIGAASSVTVSASANDDSGASGLTMALSINGKQVASVTGGALSYKWNTRNLKTGTYTLSLSVRDKAGNTASPRMAVTK